MALFKISLLVLTVSSLTCSCHPVKPYQRVYLNDREMQISNGISGKFEENAEGIREGAAPAGGIYTSGGCGCN
ncbi:MAG: DUF4266 domain-containing protein [Sphingobacteriales bacterium]|nr:DUF4266 domain-containing protein [Sphingobacteriales bacterium]